jgi:phytol kinase
MIMDEVPRKIVHLFFGLGIAVFILIAPKDLVLFALIVSIYLGFIFSDAIIRGYRLPLISHIVDVLERKDAVPGKGTLFFLLSAFVCLVFFPPGIVIPAIVALSVVDGVATPVGRRFGTHRIFNGKSAEGTLTAIVAAAVALMVFLDPVIAWLTALIAGLVELLSPIDDNLVIPIVVCLVLTLL